MTVQLRVSVEKVFVIFALLFGMLYAIITPPFQSVDEANHFLRSYAITEGQMLAQNKILPLEVSCLLRFYNSLKNFNIWKKILQNKLHLKKLKTHLQ